MTIVTEVNEGFDHASRLRATSVGVQCEAPRLQSFNAFLRVDLLRLRARKGFRWMLLRGKSEKGV